MSHRLARWGALLLLAGTAPPAAAHNGAVAVAAPVAGIAVDGDFSDWPAGPERHPILLVVTEFGSRPSGESDFQGWFSIGYSAAENALYLAVEAQDESMVTDTTSTANWDTQDGCEVYAELRHDQDGPVAQYALRGNTLQVYSAGAKLEDCQVAVRRHPGVRRYEWRLDVTQKTQGRVRLRPGMVIGVDVALADKDADGSFSWVSWGPEQQKFVWLSQVGDVVLAGPGEKLARLEGLARWEGSSQGVAHAEVQVQSLEAAARRLQVEADRDGRWSAALPAGQYRAELLWPGRGEKDQKRFQASPGGTVQVELQAPVPQGVRVPAGGGKGAWQHFGLAEGLANHAMTTILEDREGNLWFGTDWNGVNRYDGREIRTFTTQDGLADNKVWAILQDRAGALWFGTYRGLSRYDGKEFRTFTSAEGLAGKDVRAILEDQGGNLWFATAFDGVSRYDGKEFRTFTSAEGLASNDVRAIQQDQDGNIWFATGRGVNRYDGKHFAALTPPGTEITFMSQDREGALWFGMRGGVAGQFQVRRHNGRAFLPVVFADSLAIRDVSSVLQDREGNWWFSTWNLGVSRCDGKEFRTFTTADGLMHNAVKVILEDRGGNLWFGTNAGISRYTGEQFRTLTTADGLVHNSIRVIAEDREGALWFVTDGQGASRYNGREFANFSAEDGMKPSSRIIADRVGRIVADAQGNLWFGATRYDGRHFAFFTTADGLRGSPAMADRRGRLWFSGQETVGYYAGGRFIEETGIDGVQGRRVGPMLEDREGRLWLGTTRGLLCYDGQETLSFTVADGLTDSVVTVLFEDREGQLWIGTQSGGVCRYDGKGFKSWRVKDGLAGNALTSIIQDREGRLLMGTLGGGVSLFDGKVFQSLTAQDGLADDRVYNLLQDRRGDIWVATEGGVTRYRPYHTSPPVYLTQVVADQTYGPVPEIRTSTAQEYLAFEFLGHSLKTRQLAYVYRMQGHHEGEQTTRKGRTLLQESGGGWRMTREGRAVYAGLPAGEYLFEVKAVDRDLTYSEEPAQVRVIVHPAYGQLGLIIGLEIAVVGLVAVSGYALRRRRDLRRAERALLKELEKELQTAHHLQMRLMPKQAPQLPGFEVAGRCLPANHVGGDLFQYFHQDGALSLGLADVTGHAMEAAVPMMMFSGILKSQMEGNPAVEELFGRLNRSLHGSLGNRTFVCFALGQLDPTSRRFRLANAGCPYPYHYRAGTHEVVELRADAYPLGVRPDTAYRVVETRLEAGDRVVFCSDGIIEVVNTAGQQFGFERTAAVIRRGCQEGLSAEALLERIVAEARAFGEGVPQGDDQTVVVLKVEDRRNAGARWPPR
jgi:ligand-binding sensor domain-containing protein